MLKDTIRISYFPLFQILKERNMEINSLKKAGISSSTIQNISNDKEIRINTLIKIATFLECSIADVVSYEY